MSEETLIVIENWGIFIVVILLAIGSIQYLLSRGKKEPTEISQAANQIPVPGPTISGTATQNISPGTKQCFWCKAEIPADAMVCMHCSRDNRPEVIKYQISMEKSNALSQLGRSLLIIAALIFLALWLLGAFSFF